MFTERLRSHHDAEARLTALLKSASGRGRGGSGGGHPGGGATLRRIARMVGLKPPAKNEKLLREILTVSPAQPGSRAGVYIHVPYCDRICSFCNLNRQERTGADLAAYTAYIISEIKTWGAYPYIQKQNIETVYFGGGTPTVLSAAQMQGILRALHDTLPLAKDCEITVETTQHNLGVEKAAALEAAGVNRLSVGIQTFAPRGRELLNRTYTAEKAAAELRALRETFSGVLGIDIIYSYPGQTLEELRGDAEMCAATGIDSLSFYSLMIHEGSSLAAGIRDKKLDFQRDIAFDLERHNLLYSTLRAAGFRLLELTKLARPNRDEYRYIQAQYGLWDVLPIGAGAGGRVAGFGIYSMSPGRRFVAPPDTRHETYSRLLGRLQFGRYDAPDIANGLSVASNAAIEDVIASFIHEGLLESDRSLTASGVFWGNNMAVKMLEAVVQADTK